MDYEKEIPFGAFDSELMHEEITIPEGFEATIDGNKIILKKIESKDEKIRKRLIDFFEDWHKNRSHCWGIAVTDILAWLEKQGSEENKGNLGGISSMKEALRTEYEKGRADAFAQMQKSWSEEDDEIINGIISYLCTHDSCELDGFNKWYDWLKSLKERYT